ncbi:hypothetical protein TNCV_158841 [Trichonephila clavipes]|uniref:Uncharacterized protein n=1 Tax=Trichonephila clavipes TaxID=2585209 RepID=A0A8X6UQ55_TRICX|nr:hypothetical protein TNCV_158841 [Trichonephila clavipes]
MTHAQNAEVAADWQARCYLRTNHDGRQTCADNEVTNRSMCCYPHHECICDSSVSFVNWLVTNFAYSMKEGRMSRMKVEVGTPPHPNIKTVVF